MRVKRVHNLFINVYVLHVWLRYIYQISYVLSFNLVFVLFIYIYIEKQIKWCFSTQKVEEATAAQLVIDFLKNNYLKIYKKNLKF
jgi:hypothetical protein